MAAGHGDVSTVEAWLSQGGDINSSINYGFNGRSTLLSAAIVGRQTQMREYLVARGARCGKSDVYCLLEEILASPSYLEIARLLIEHGADPALGNDGGWGAPHKLAVLVGRKDTYLQGQARSRSALLIRFLVEKGAPVDLRVTASEVRLGVGATPLMVAVAESAPVVYLRELLRLGADLSATNEEGDSALSLAQSAINAPDAIGTTPAARQAGVIAKQAALIFITDVSRAGTYKRYINEPRKRLLVLRKLVERGRATAPRARPPFEAAGRYAGPRAGMVFTTRDGATGYYRDAAAYVPERLFCASTLPDVLFWKVLSFWRTSRDGRPL